MPSTVTTTPLPYSVVSVSTVPTTSSFGSSGRSSPSLCFISSRRSFRSCNRSFRAFSSACFTANFRLAVLRLLYPVTQSRRTESSKTASPPRFVRSWPQSCACVEINSVSEENDGVGRAREGRMERSEKVRGWRAHHFSERSPSFAPLRAFAFLPEGAFRRTERHLLAGGLLRGHLAHGVPLVPGVNAPPTDFPRKSLRFGSRNPPETEILKSRRLDGNSHALKPGGRLGSARRRRTGLSESCVRLPKASGDSRRVVRVASRPHALRRFRRRVEGDHASRGSGCAWVALEGRGSALPGKARTGTTPRCLS